MIEVRTTRRRLLLAGVVLAGWPRGTRAQGTLPTPRASALKDWRSAPGLGPLEEAFKYLESAKLDDKAPGRYPIDGDRVYMTIAEGRTRDPSAGKFEAHRKYADVHFLIRGGELIGSEPAADLRSTQAYDPAADIEFFATPPTYRRLVVKAGEFAVFFPGQAHMPGLHPEGAEVPFKKAVIKVLVGRA